MDFVVGVKNLTISDRTYNVSFEYATLEAIDALVSFLNLLPPESSSVLNVLRPLMEVCGRNSPDSINQISLNRGGSNWNSYQCH